MHKQIRLVCLSWSSVAGLTVTSVETIGRHNHQCPLANFTPSVESATFVFLLFDIVTNTKQQ